MPKAAPAAGRRNEKPAKPRDKTATGGNAAGMRRASAEMQAAEAGAGAQPIRTLWKR